jgi:hypothetical protein
MSTSGSGFAAGCGVSAQTAACTEQTIIPTAIKVRMNSPFPKQFVVACSVGQAQAEINEETGSNRSASGFR